MIRQGRTQSIKAHLASAAKTLAYTAVFWSALLAIPLAILGLLAQIPGTEALQAVMLALIMLAAVAGYPLLMILLAGTEKKQRSK